VPADLTTTGRNYKCLEVPSRHFEGGIAPDRSGEDGTYDIHRSTLFVRGCICKARLEMFLVPHRARAT